MGRGIAALSVLASFAIPVQMGASAAAQDATPPPNATPAVQPLDQRFMESLTRGHYLEAMDMVEQADPSEVNDLVQSTYGQFRPVLDGFVVNGAAPDPSVTPDDAELAAYDGAEAQDAIAAIVSQARQTRIVIVNETHDNPRDRAFILKVAEALRPLGFTHYAAETFTNFSPDAAAEEMGWLESQGYPRWTSGTFTVDPMFAYLVRRVLALGYHPVAYETAFSPEFLAASTEDRIALREQAQAENLVRALAEAGPDAKFLIHVGYAHAGERPLPPTEQGWMAARLAGLTRIDPLTVDQTTFAETASNQKVRALQRVLASRLAAGPAIFFKDGKPVSSGQLGQAVDLQVVHSLVTAVDGRPDWLRETGRRSIAIPPELLPIEGRRLVQVFAAGEAPDAIPLDQALVTAGEELPVLYVPDNVGLRWAVQD